MHEDFWIDTLKTHYPLGLNNINPIPQVFFNIFISFHCITGNIYFCFFVIGLFYERESQSTFYFCFPYMLLLHMEPWDPPQNTLVSLHRVTCLLVIVTFIQVYWLLRTLLLFTVSGLGNRNCTNGFLLIVCAVIVQKYYESKIVKL